MTQTITIVRCNHCPMYCPPDMDGRPALCTHEDSRWAKVTVHRCSDEVWDSVCPGPCHMPSNCPLLQSPVTYRAERKGE